MRKAGIALLTGAIACAAASAYIRFVMVPDAEQVQSDTHTVNHYAGTASFLDTQTIATGDLAHAFKKEVPFTAVEDFKTASLHGGTAVITDATTVSGPAAPALASTTVNWAVDRKTLLPAAAPAGSDAVDHKGLVVGFPFDPDAKDYPWWDDGTAKQATAKYVRTEKHADRTAYVYTVEAGGSLADKTILAKVPPSIQAEVLKGLAASVAPDQASALAVLLPKNGGEGPLSYASTTKSTLWVDEFSGTTLNVDIQQTVTVELKSALGSVADSVKQSKDDQSRMLWEGEVAPGALAALALVLLVGAVVAWRRRDAVTAAGDSAAGETAGEDEASEGEPTST
ncbi:MAG: hypothetical protein AUG49_10365 [Catenulispora sp. 13_1_20CM_3_70_7]|nr:MAG: hypothetical protein AUG49_10365 [Catenulispora sp. 13_1_20CM_3_70_7]